ncbi:abortive infection protein [Actinomadura oligospora]|uniref:abortive infection protein n=1 Tax=Actinomadura oligospora TaxID=111804 RepID=UPI000A00158A|nr:abortive infection protein [Actinomadura oligospora]
MAAVAVVGGAAVGRPKETRARGIAWVRGEEDARRGGRAGLAQRGVNYDTVREVWKAAFVRREIRAIRRDLHCNAVILLGDDLRRLEFAARCAADEGLFVWFEPRQFDKDAARTLAFVRSVARMAERLRRRHPGVGMSMGCELTIFMDGLVPGKTWEERGANLGTPAGKGYNERLNAFLVRAHDAVRPLFGGQLTYTSGVWESVEWRKFDVVGVDLYRDASNEASYRRDVRALHRFGKPVVITEFGCCTYRGAEKRGGDGFSIVDWTQDPPVVPDGYVRDERVQSRYLGELLDVFEDEGVHGAFVYNFINPDTPYSPDPRHDLDMAGFSLVRVGADYARTGRFEAKDAFRVVARRFSPRS